MGITMIATGAFRETGASFFFIPKGALTHHLVVTSSISLDLPQSGRSRSFRCSSSPHKAGFAGTPVRRWYPSLRSGRALCEADCALFGERQTMPPSLRTLVVIACTAGRQLAPCLPLRCKLLSFVGTTCHPPAKTCHCTRHALRVRQLSRRDGRCHPAPSIFFCRAKRNKTAPCRGQKGRERLWRSIIWKQRS